MYRFARRPLTLSLCVLATSLAGACAPSDTRAPVFTPVVLQPEDRAPAASITVERGDTLYTLSRRANVSLRALIDTNRLTPPYQLRIGQVLTLPGNRDHVVERGDTLSGIARRHGVEVSALVRLNRVAPPYTIYPGQRLRLPSSAGDQAGSTGEAIGSETVVVVSPQLVGRERPAAVARSPSPPAPQVARRAPVSAPAAAAGAPPPDPPPAAQAAASPAPADLGPPPALHAAGFLWPVRGEVIGNYGPAAKGQHNDGINIAVPRGEPVRAAEGGVVVYAGSEMKGFGNLLLIKHADGWMTAYAHNEALLVGRGDVVERGQVVARAGNTGNVSEPQLHFEIRRGTRAVDPHQYLRDGRV